MQALLLERSGSIALQDVPVPRPPPGECLVRVRAAGIPCGNGSAAPARLRGVRGHPRSRVRRGCRSGRLCRFSLDRQARRRRGHRVRRCEWCARGVREHCTSRTVLGIRGRDGAFAEFLTLPAVNLHEIPPSIDDRTAVFVEPVAACCRILEQVDVGDRTRVAVLGDGRMGPARGAGPPDRCRRRHRLRPPRSQADNRQRVRALTPGALRRGRTVGPFDIVVDVTGRPEGLRSALELGGRGARS